MPRLTAAERQERFKDKNNAAGRTEFRGAWLTDPEKDEVRKLVRRIIKRRK